MTIISVKSGNQGRQQEISVKSYKTYLSKRFPARGLLTDKGLELIVGSLVLPQRRNVRESLLALGAKMTKNKQIIDSELVKFHYGLSIFPIRLFFLKYLDFLFGQNKFFC